MRTVLHRRWIPPGRGKAGDFGFAYGRFSPNLRVIPVYMQSEGAFCAATRRAAPRPRGDFSVLPAEGGWATLIGQRPGHMDRNKEARGEG